MSFKPVIGNLVQVDVSASDISSSGASSGQLLAANGSGGASWVNPADQYIDGEVATYADLPVAAGVPPVNSAYLVRQGSGVYLVNRKPAGIYVRNTNNGNLADWSYAGAFPDVFTDSNFTVYNASDSSKNLKFDASGIATNTTRTLTVPDKNGTIATTDDVATKEPLQTPMTQAEAEAGTGTSTRSVTPQRIAQAITALAVNFLRGAANTWSAIQTFTSSFVANGTNNTAPNQVGVVPTSSATLLTRSQTDLHRIIFPFVTRQPAADWSYFTAGTGTSSGSASTDVRLSINSSDTSAVASSSSFVAPYPNWGKTIVWSWIISHHGTASLSALGKVQGSVGSTTSGTDLTLTGKGVGWIIDSATTAKIFVHNGSSLTTSSSFTVPSQFQPNSDGLGGYFMETISLVFTPGVSLAMYLNIQGIYTYVGAITTGLPSPASNNDQAIRLALLSNGGATNDVVRWHQYASGYLP